MNRRPYKEVDEIPPRAAQELSPKRFRKWWFGSRPTKCASVWSFITDIRQGRIDAANNNQ